MEIKNNIVFSFADLARGFQPRVRCLARSNDVVNRVVSVKEGCDPVFKQDVHLGVWQKSFERDEGRSCKNSVADGAKPNNENAPDLLPVDLFLVLGFGSLVFGHDSFSFPNLLTTDN